MKTSILTTTTASMAAFGLAVLPVLAIDAAPTPSKEAADVVDGGGEVFARLTTDPPVWELTAAEYADELSVYTDPTVKEFMDRIAAGAKPANDDEIFFLNRWRELVPAGFESDPEDIASMYDQIQYVAKSFGSVVDDVGDF